MGVQGHTQACRQPLEAGKDKETVFLGPPEGTIPAKFDFSFVGVISVISPSEL